MSKSYRKERINERLKELISELIVDRAKDPRIGLVTITSAEVTPDLTSAKVYYSVMGDEDARSETQKGLDSAKSFFRKAVGQELKLRQVPELVFVYDDSLDRAMRIEDAINRMSRRTDQDEETDSDT